MWATQMKHYQNIRRSISKNRLKDPYHFVFRNNNSNYNNAALESDDFVSLIIQKRNHLLETIFDTKLHFVFCQKIVRAKKIKNRQELHKFLRKADLDWNYPIAFYSEDMNCIINFGYFDDILIQLHCPEENIKTVLNLLRELNFYELGYLIESNDSLEKSEEKWSYKKIDIKR